MSILYTPCLTWPVVVCEAFLRNMVFDIWFALVVIFFIMVFIGSFVFGRAVSAFFLPLVVLVWILFFFRKPFVCDQKDRSYIQKP